MKSKRVLRIKGYEELAPSKQRYFFQDIFGARQFIRSLQAGQTADETDEHFVTFLSPMLRYCFKKHSMRFYIFYHFHRFQSL